MGAIAKLISISNQLFSERVPVIDEITGRLFSSEIGQELYGMLSKKNGFFAFEQALQVYSTNPEYYPNLIAWNALEGWRSEYSWLDKKVIFFAQDIFGVQFCISESKVKTFDPETGKFETLAASLDEWASLILKDYNFLTGYPLAKQWQTVNGQLKINDRLIPKIPFVAGGAFEINNLFAVDCERGMRIRANIAKQIKDTPDGSAIQFKIS